MFGPPVWRWNLALCSWHDHSCAVGYRWDLSAPSSDLWLSLVSGGNVEQPCTLTWYTDAWSQLQQLRWRRDKMLESIHWLAEIHGRSELACWIESSCPIFDFQFPSTNCRRLHKHPGFASRAQTVDRSSSHPTWISVQNKGHHQPLLGNWVKRFSTKAFLQVGNSKIRMVMNLQWHCIHNVWEQIGWEWRHC